MAALGAIPLPVIQKYLNFHYSVSLDLFGGDTSTNVANYYTAGLKGRWMEERRKDDHLLDSDSIMVDALLDAGTGQQSIAQTEVSALVGLNTDLRRQYIADCEGGVKRWNRILEGAGLPHRLALPHPSFNRKVGAFAGIEASPAGEILTAAEWEQRKEPVAADRHRQDVRAVADAPGPRAREDSRMAGPAAQRHQRPAVRLRLRAPRLDQKRPPPARPHQAPTSPVTLTSPNPSAKAAAMAQLFNACEYLLDRRLAAGDGQRLALTGPAGDLTYAELHDRVRRTAAGLRAAACSRSSEC